MKVKDKPPLTTTFARNLALCMGDRWNQLSLSKHSGVPQTTISLYLHPERRGSLTPSGKISGPNFTHLVRLADALDVEAWELLHPDLERARRERAMYAQIEESYKRLRQDKANNNI